ncbi:MAG TPA: hypothetical protein VMT15_05245 [Bryobacteraceae bacterium]|nr:hypothetical protein [Bryobacteraceae bacterium]
MIPASAILTVENADLFDRDDLVEVTWGEKKIMMFGQDLRSRAKRT